MRNLFERRVLETIRRKHLLAAGDRVGVAVSSGADSVALLRLLGKLRQELGIGLLVVHFDHMLRGAESRADSEFVAALAARASLEFIVAREDVGAAAACNGWNLEEAGRRLRYAFFEQLVSAGRATRIAVAHTADDQAETVLAHMIRGTGPAGLGGVYPTAGPIVRPLLWTRRAELRTYLREIGQDWREDPTNQDTARLRARIRADLVPLLEHNFSPRIVEHLGELSRLSREQEVFWKALADERFHALARSGRGGIEIEIADLLTPLRMEDGWGAALVPEAQRVVTERLIRRLYQEMKGDCRGLAAKHVEQVISLATRSTSGHAVDLPGGILARLNFGVLAFSRRTPIESPSDSDVCGADRAARYEYALQLPSRGDMAISVPELGTRFLLKVVDWASAERETIQEGEALDADLVGNSLLLRSWRPGDAYRPRGCRGRRKLKQLFQAGEVPVSDRAGWPVIESAGRVVWARGLPVADEVAARSGTRTGVLIEEHRI